MNKLREHPLIFIAVLVIVAGLIWVSLPGCGTLYPRTTIRGGQAQGTVIKDRSMRLKVTPVNTVPALDHKPTPATGGCWKMVIKGGE